MNALLIAHVGAGVLDLNAILRKKLTAAQRVSRHLWRMCFAFFIATGSFFLGQQDVMLFWLMRLRFAKAIARSRESGVIFIGGHPPPHA